MTDLLDVSWPVERLGEVVEVVARRGGLSPDTIEAPVAPAQLASEGYTAIAHWIETTTTAYGLEAEPVHTPYPELPRMLGNCAPAVLMMAVTEKYARLLAVVATGRRHLLLLAPDGSLHRVDASLVAHGLCRFIEAPLEAELDHLLDAAGVTPARRQRARAAILQERLASRRIRGCWLIRLPASAGFWRQLMLARLPHRFAALITAHSVQYLLWILSWWVVGRAALQGRLDHGWLIAWALLLLAVVPFRLLATWSQGVFAIGAGAVLKRRLLQGALRLEPEEIRCQGAGQLLGRVIESEAVESLAMSGGFLAVFALIELGIAGWVLSAGAAGILHPLLLLAATVVSILLGWRFYRLRRQWTHGRLDMTHALVESMVGHRTRLAQEHPERWHRGEDEVLERYLTSSRTMDRAAIVLTSVLPRAWMLLAIAALAPAFVTGAAGSAALAVGLGGTLLGLSALSRLLSGIQQIIGAAIAWEQVRLLYHAAVRQESIGSAATTLALATGTAAPEEMIVDAHQLVFRYQQRGEPVLKGCNLRVKMGDRILIEGPSGGGKSTLASLLVGLRQPESGLLLLRGLDYQTVGADWWSRRVVAAPQFHENHVLAETFAFNLLMGRGWPSGPGDMREAQELCQELGLGELLERMPAGLLQMVGETGWQLSHGERSRLYIARALLQRADLVVLDESFAALDPENLHRALRCVLQRAPTLVVIAHP